jgi:UDP-N-acetylmuramate dehydrogenase
VVAVTDEQAGVSLSALTTLRVGGPAEHLMTVGTTADLAETLRSSASANWLLISGGSNVVVADSGVLETVVLVHTRGISLEAHEDDTVTLDAAAGESWDSLVERCIDEGLSGVEALSGIPGSVGATPIQNVGAYGQEVSDVITTVEVLDRRDGSQKRMPAETCGFGYRTSVFKREPNRFAVLTVQLRLHRGKSSPPLKYRELTRALGVDIGGTAPTVEVREAALDLRRSKGMVLDDDDHDTWSVGSFFTNPHLPQARVPAGAPAWPAADGRSKVSAAWLIEHAGFAKGFGASVGSGRATISTKHSLAITNRGEATADDVLELARTLQQGVRSAFGVALEPEPTLVGLTL